MTTDVEARLRNADPLKQDTVEGAEGDRRWLQNRIQVVATTAPGASREPGRHRALMAAAAAAVVLTGGAGAIIADVFDAPDRPAGAEAPMELAMAPETMSMASCIPFSVEFLAGMPVAFSGTVVEDDGERVLMQVDRWYRGGDTDQVRLLAPDITMTSLDGMLDFDEGRRYLVTAASGTVNYCGFSAVWSEERAKDYQEAFSPSR